MSRCGHGGTSQFAGQRTCLCVARAETAPSARASAALGGSPRFSERFGLLEPASVPPRALDMPMNCSSAMSNLGNFCLLARVWLTFLLGRIFFHCTFILVILTFAVSSTCLFTSELSCPGECFLCVVILKILGCVTSTGFTVGWTRVFATCSLVRCWILS